MNGETDARPNADAVPLPPVLTRWTEPDATDGEASALLPPFYASRRELLGDAPEPAAPMESLPEMIEEPEPWDELILDDALDLEPDTDLEAEPVTEAVAAAPAEEEPRGTDWEAFGRVVEESAEWFDASLRLSDTADDDDDGGAEAPPQVAYEMPEGFEAGEFEPASAGTHETPDDDTGTFDLEVVGLESIEIVEDGPDTGMEGMVPLGGMLHSAPDDGPAEPPADPLARDLAERLVRLAERLRDEGTPGLANAMAEGDRLDASIAGFLAGYVAARGE